MFDHESGVFQMARDPLPLVLGDQAEIKRSPVGQGVQKITQTHAFCNR